MTRGRVVDGANGEAAHPLTRSETEMSGHARLCSRLSIDTTDSVCPSCSLSVSRRGDHCIVD